MSEPQPERVALHHCLSTGVEHEWRKVYDGGRFSIWECRRCHVHITDTDLGVALREAKQ